MAQFYQLTEYKAFREPWENQHTKKMNQTYFVKFDGVDQSVMVNKEVGNLPIVGQNYGSLEVVPGKEYLKFKSEKAPDGVTPPPVKPQLLDMGKPENLEEHAQANDLKAVNKKLDEINQKLDKLLFKTVATDEDMSNPIDVSQIPF